MKQTFVIKDTKTSRVIDTVIGFMADAIKYMTDHADLQDHAGIFPVETSTTNNL